LAVSFILPAIAYLVYRWHKSRDQQEEEVPEESTSEIVEEAVHAKQKEVERRQELQEKLQSICRSRLETLEEETAEEKEELKVVEVEKEAADTETQSDIKGTSKEKTPKPEPIFGATDIRYRHKPISEGIVIDNSESESEVEDMVEKVVDEAVMVLDEREVEEVDLEAKVPSVLAALQDPLCLASPPSPNSYSSSPVKSEASSEGRQSTEWSDLIEQDERESFQKVLTSKLSGLDLNEGRARGGDSGVVSPSEDSTEGERERLISESNSKSRSHSGEDAGIGSEQGDLLSEAGAGLEGHLEDAQLMSYQFHIPDYLCGKLIGLGGTYIKKLKEECRCNIVLKETDGLKPKKGAKGKRGRNNRQQASAPQGEIKVCSIEGTRASIDKCLDIVKQKFLEHREEVTFEQVNKGSGLSIHSGSVSLSLAEGCMHEVFVSSIVGGGHVFLQQPYHPTFHALERLDACMTKLYSSNQCPALPSPLPVNTVCVAAYEGGWYRCQVVSVDEAAQQCDIKYLDYGGYHTLPIDDLRQIRTDFLSLPFQAIECYLANISPKDDENVSAFVLEELIAHQIVQARMIGTNESGVPMIHLYRASNGQTTMVNKELVDRSCANWIETTIVQLDPSEVATSWIASGNFQSMSLLPDPSSQVNPIYHQPDQDETIYNNLQDAMDVNQQGVFGSPWEEQYMRPPVLPNLGDFLLM